MSKNRNSDHFSPASGCDSSALANWSSRPVLSLILAFTRVFVHAGRSSAPARRTSLGFVARSSSLHSDTVPARNKKRLQWRKPSQPIFTAHHNPSQGYDAKPKIPRHPILLLCLAIVLFLKVAAVAQAEVIDRVVAIVNDEVITQSEVEKALMPISAQYAAIYRNEELLQKLSEARHNIINKLIENKLILAEAKNAGIEISDEEIEAKIEELKRGFSSQDEFEAVLFKQGLGITDLKENFRNQIMIQKIINRQIKSKVVIKPTEIVDYYYTHLDDFTNPQEVKISNILIKVEDKVDAPGAYQRAEKVLSLLENGANFAQVAREYSDGPQREKGGSVGFVSRGQMIKEIDEVIFKLKVGEISGLIKSSLGYHIVKVEDIRPAYVKDLTLVQSEIEDILFQEKMERNFAQWLEKLRENAYISIKKE